MHDGLCTPKDALHETGKASNGNIKVPCDLLHQQFPVNNVDNHITICRMSLFVQVMPCDHLDSVVTQEAGNLLHGNPVIDYSGTITAANIQL